MEKRAFGDALLLWHHRQLGFAGQHETALVLARQHGIFHEAPDRELDDLFAPPGLPSSDI